MFPGKWLPIRGGFPEHGTDKRDGDRKITSERMVMADLSIPTVQKLLQSTTIAHLATIGPDGRPQSSPMAFHTHFHSLPTRAASVLPSRSGCPGVARSHQLREIPRCTTLPGEH